MNELENKEASWITENQEPEPRNSTYKNWGAAAVGALMVLPFSFFLAPPALPLASIGMAVYCVLSEKSVPQKDRTPMAVCAGIGAFVSAALFEFYFRSPFYILVGISALFVIDMLTRKKRNREI